MKTKSTVKVIPSKLDVPVCVPDNMYNFHIWAYRGSKDQFGLWFGTHFNASVEDVKTITSFSADCLCSTYGRNILIFIDGRYPLTDTDMFAAISHECLHATFHVMRTRGMKLGKKSEEAFCYYHSWILSQVYNVLREDK